MSPTPPDTNRPHPIRRAMAVVGGAILAIGTAANGLLSAAAAEIAQGTSAEDLVAGAPVIGQILVVVAAAAGVIKRAEAETTPSSNPAAVVNGYLVSLVQDAAQRSAALRGGRDDDTAPADDVPGYGPGYDPGYDR